MQAWSATTICNVFRGGAEGFRSTQILPERRRPRLAAGAGILKTTDNPEGAQRFIEYLLSETAQAYFSTTTKEYPLVDGASVDPGLPPLPSLEPRDVDLGDLTDARGTLSLLREVGIIP